MSEERRTDGLETSELLFRACHDMKAPIRSIRTHAELLLRDAGTLGSADSEQRLGFIIEGARKIDLLADGLSSYSIALGIEAHSFRPTRTEMVLRLALAKVGKELGKQGAEVTYDALPCVMGDPDRLSQVFENLLLNAVRHRGAAVPRIHVTAERQGEFWLFAVRDNGPGMEAVYLDRIFKPFERLRGKDSDGPGLGLTISREIVERHGGRIWAEAAVGAGSTFFFTLPVGEPLRD